MRAYAAEGHFKAGSMGPKVEACLRFVDAGGESVIASLTEVGPALAGQAGTHIVPDAPAKRGASVKPAARKAPAKKAASRRSPRPRRRRRRRPGAARRPAAAPTSSTSPPPGGAPPPSDGRRAARRYA